MLPQICELIPLQRQLICKYLKVTHSSNLPTEILEKGYRMSEKPEEKYPLIIKHTIETVFVIAYPVNRSYQNDWIETILRTIYPAKKLI